MGACLAEEKRYRTETKVIHVHKAGSKQLSKKLLIKPFVVYRMQRWHRVNAVIGNYLKKQNQRKTRGNSEIFRRLNLITLHNAAAGLQVVLKENRIHGISSN